MAGSRGREILLEKGESRGLTAGSGNSHQVHNVSYALNVPYSTENVPPPLAISLIAFPAPWNSESFIPARKHHKTFYLFVLVYVDVASV